MNKKRKFQNLDEIRAWSKQNGFIYPSSEIYGGYQAIYDYGHYGYILKENIRNEWVKSMIQETDNIVLLDSAIFMHPKTWEASGHTKGFDDILVEDKKTNKRYRADHLIEEFLEKNKEFKNEKLKEIKKEEVKNAIEKNDFDKLSIEDIEKTIEVFKIKSPDGNELTKPKKFNMLVQSNLGNTTSKEEETSYLRGETCQGIYLNFKNILDSTRMKVPFGIAQTGKAFRNEIVARQYIFRTREFEQMELQYFIHPSENEETYKEWKEKRMNWYINKLGIKKEKLKFKKHEKLVFYAKAADDITYQFNCLNRFDEIEGIHARSDYDLKQHQKYSKCKLEYFDQQRNEKYTPWIVEASSGLNRILLMILDNYWEEEELEDKTKRIVLKLPKKLAPIKIGILPLSKKENLQEKSKEIKKQLQEKYIVEYDETGSIGKRYRRQDEIGTPYCITVDFDTLEDNAVTIRERDSMEQIRIPINEIGKYFSENL